MDLHLTEPSGPLEPVDGAPLGPLPGCWSRSGFNLDLLKQLMVNSSVIGCLSVVVFLCDSYNQSDEHTSGTTNAFS